MLATIFPCFLPRESKQATSDGFGKGSRRKTEDERVGRMLSHSGHSGLSQTDASKLVVSSRMDISERRTEEEFLSIISTLEWDALRRDAMVVATAPAAVTVFTPAGLVLHQNTLSKIFYGNSQISEMQASNVLSLLFSFEPAKHTFMMDSLHSGRVWKAVLRVPPSLVFLNCNQQPLQPPTHIRNGNECQVRGSLQQQWQCLQQQGQQYSPQRQKGRTDAAKHPQQQLRTFLGSCAASVTSIIAETEAQPEHRKLAGDAALARGITEERVGVVEEHQQQASNVVFPDNVFLEPAQQEERHQHAYFSNSLPESYINIKSDIANAPTNAMLYLHGMTTSKTYGSSSIRCGTQLEPLLPISAIPIPSEGNFPLQNNTGRRKRSLSFTSIPRSKQCAVQSMIAAAEPQKLISGVAALHRQRIITKLSGLTSSVLSSDPDTATPNTSFGLPQGVEPPNSPYLSELYENNTCSPIAVATLATSTFAMLLTSTSPRNITSTPAPSLHSMPQPAPVIIPKPTQNLSDKKLNPESVISSSCTTQVSRMTAALDSFGSKRSTRNINQDDITQDETEQGATRSEASHIVEQQDGGDGAGATAAAPPAAPPAVRNRRPPRKMVSTCSLLNAHALSNISRTNSITLQGSPSSSRAITFALSLNTSPLAITKLLDQPQQEQSQVAPTRARKGLNLALQTAPDFSIMPSGNSSTSGHEEDGVDESGRGRQSGVSLFSSCDRGAVSAARRRASAAPMVKELLDTDATAATPIPPVTDDTEPLGTATQSALSFYGTPDDDDRLAMAAATGMPHEPQVHKGSQKQLQSGTHLQRLQQPPQQPLLPLMQDSLLLQPPQRPMAVPLSPLNPPPMATLQAAPTSLNHLLSSPPLQLGGVVDRQPECWHEVWATSARDPITGDDVIVLTQMDVTSKVIAERHLALVMETEHRLVEQLFPRHILKHITEQWTAPENSNSNSNAVAAGGAVEGGSWRPVIQDCNALATSHPEVTLLFADIKGFTPMCEQVEPKEVMALLNVLYSQYDAMLDKFGVYKVETIGDCYFVAGGLIQEDEDGMAAVRGSTSSAADPLHAEKVFMFAKAMLSAARGVRLPTTGQPVDIRIGLHTGSVVSGVVGTRMPRFCLFGDTVNTASRMESTGTPGAIHASEATFRRLPRSDQWEPTGGIEVKGKGLMQTYLWRPNSITSSPQHQGCTAAASRAGHSTVSTGPGSVMFTSAATQAAFMSAHANGSITAQLMGWSVRQSNSSSLKGVFTAAAAAMATGGSTSGLEGSISAGSRLGRR